MASGYEIVDRGGDVLMIDADVAHMEPYRSLCGQHERVFVMPHGAGRITPNPPHPHTRGYFVTSQGQADTLREAGITLPIAVMGWHFTPIKPFRPCDLSANPHVIFAPTHAMKDGRVEEGQWVVDEARRIYEWLCDLPIRLTVRTVEAADPYHFPKRDGVTFQQGTGMLADAVAAIETADMVLAGAWTFPMLSVALGVPTIQVQLSEPGMTWAVMERAAVLPLPGLVDYWIGEPWDAPTFVRLFEQAVETW